MSTDFFKTNDSIISDDKPIVLGDGDVVVQSDGDQEEWYKKEWIWGIVGAGLGAISIGIACCRCFCCKEEPLEVNVVNVVSVTVTSPAITAETILEFILWPFKKAAEALGLIESSTPIAISLSPDKEIEVIKYEDSNVCFKYDGENCKKTSWVGSETALLFYDFDGSKKADHPGKIVLTEWSKDAKTDFQAMLEVFDSNKDNVFDARDAEFSKFYVWQDKNSDGVVYEGELKSLEKAGIVAIDFKNTQGATLEEIGNGILNKAKVVWTSGETTEAGDLVLMHDV